MQFKELVYDICSFEIDVLSIFMYRIHFTRPYIMFNLILNGYREFVNTRRYMIFLVFGKHILQFPYIIIMMMLLRRNQYITNYPKCIFNLICPGSTRYIAIYVFILIKHNYVYITIVFTIAARLSIFFLCL